MKKYGIYILFSPIIDLRCEGLGKHLAYFLKASKTQKEVNFVIAAPSWMRAPLTALFEDYQIPNDAFEIFTPDTIPLVLRIYFWSDAIIKRLTFIRLIDTLITNSVKTDISSKPSNKLSLLSIFLIILFKLFNNIIDLIKKKLKNSKCIKSVWSIMVLKPKQSFALRKNIFLRKLFISLQENEANRMNDTISKRKDILAWYCPTLFWPSFNKIEAPKLITAPDVVLNEFPTGFAIYAKEIYLQYANVKCTISEGKYFTTYSNNVKYNTLVKNYGINPDNVFVIHHGANKLNHLIEVSHPIDKEKATKEFAKQLFNQALLSVQHHHYASRIYSNSDIRFIFYASQARPNKNIISLLKAYEYLLRKKYISKKLVLTCNRFIIHEIGRFVSEKNLENDVLFLHGISMQQLAGCYKLADIAVNPSLSEGGMPFTFTEALSVGTPVVMAKINVTEELIIDPHLQEAMLFDPYDWRDMADTIYKGLMNPQKLLDLQLPFYNRLAARDWKDVVSDTISALNKIVDLEKSKDAL